MYYFSAVYTNLNTNEEIRRGIEFEGQFFANERECYIYAMGRAFDLKEDDEHLDFVEFIAC